METGNQIRAVLLRDGAWPQQRGICCWRHGFREAFSAVGASVSEATWTPPPSPNSDRAAAQQAWLPWMPQPVRRPLAGAYRRSRRSLTRLRNRAGRLISGRREGRPGAGAIPGLDGATIVVAESLRAARAAVRSGTPARRVWALALPPQWLPPGGNTGYALELNDTAGLIGGFLADGELARESVERAVLTSRPKVELFPPIAVDRDCPDCRAEPAAAGTDGGVGKTDSGFGKTDSGVGKTDSGGRKTDPGPVQLAAWRDLADRARSGAAVEPMPYSFPAARLRGLPGPWLPANRSAWQAVPTDTPMVMPADEPSDWTAAAQVAGARAVRDAVIPPPPRNARPPRRAVLAGYDLKFAVDLAERLDQRRDLDLTVDDWPRLAKPTHQTEELLERADAIFAEWARTSAIWLSQRKRPDQFLAVRLHRFELDAPYPHQIAMDNVDAVVYIAPLFGRRIRDELGWPLEKLVYIPNFMDVDWLDRPKVPGAQFTLGFVGLEFIRKRFDLALDLLAEVRRTDPRFTMAVRGVMPWENKYAWENDDERDYVGWCFERIDRDPLLRDAVTIHSPGRDMARWFRRVGYIVSTSDEEGSHASVAEGMASGAVPVVRPWPGAAEIYDKEWVHGSTSEAAAAVLANVDPTVWAERSARARAEIRRSHNPHDVVAAWADLLHGDVAGARRYFAEYSSL